MRSVIGLKAAIRATLAIAGASICLPALSAEDTLPEVIVTAQKKAESIQEVPIAVSAFDSSELMSRGLDSGKDVLQAIPNMNFSKGNFTGFNLQIRGVGNKLVGAGSPGVGIHLNNAPLAASRFFEAEFYDVERIEVLRGPQGTVYGRNATGGVFNAITARPTDKFEGSLTIDGGNYSSVKSRAMINLPINDVFQFRLAGSFLNRDGYEHDDFHNTDVDGRKLMSGRATLAFKPTDSFRGYLMYEYFKEDDDRERVGKQLCTRDPGPATVGGVSTTQPIAISPLQTQAQARWFLSQGCLSGSLYSPQAFQPFNGNASLGGLLGNLTGAISGDYLAGAVVSRDMRTTNSYFLPTYYAKSGIGMLNLEVDLNDDLLLTSLTSYNDDELRSTADYNRIAATGTFNAVPLTILTSAPPYAFSNFFTDPQLGRANVPLVSDISQTQSTTFTQELRLQSSFDGALNFNVGAIYIDNDNPAPEGGYFVLFNTATIYAQCFNLGVCNNNVPPPAAFQMYIDPNANPTGQGHNYYVNRQPAKTTSTAGFGEMYWAMNDDLKWTLGLRYTDDKLETWNYNILLLAPGTGWNANQVNYRQAQFKETTGRFGLDWKLSPDNMVYLFYSKGYKSGGMNPATQAATVQRTFDPEFVNSIELGSKNTFADGRLQLNATAFYYDYEGYQISRIEQKTSINSNIDAKIQGVELEGAWQPNANFRLDGNVGYLKTEIQGGSAIDLLNRTQSNPAQTVVKASDGSNCVTSTAALATLLGLMNAQVPFIPTGPGTFRAANPRDLLGICSGAWAALGLVPSEGTPVSLNGKELPNAPKLTYNIGAQTMFNLGSSWRGVARVDYYHQGESYARMWNTIADRLEDRSNLNLSFSISNPDAGWDFMAYVKNATDEDSITDTYLTDDSSGLWFNTFIVDPRLFGLSITKKF